MPAHPRIGRFNQRFYAKPKPRRILGKQKPIRSKQNPVRIAVGCIHGKILSAIIAEEIKEMLAEKGLQEFFEVTNFGMKGAEALSKIKNADIIVLDTPSSGSLYRQWMKNTQTKKYEKVDVQNVISNFRERGAKLSRLKKMIAKKLVLFQQAVEEIDEMASTRKAVARILNKIRKEFRLVK
mgnify:FL=1